MLVGHPKPAQQAYTSDAKRTSYVGGRQPFKQNFLNLCGAHGLSTALPLRHQRAQAQTTWSSDATNASAQSLTQPERLPVISLISANVEADALVQTFETVAGRSAMVGFSIALAAEMLTPRGGQGLFGGFDNAATSIFCAHGALLISCTAILACMSKRRLGLKLHSAVLATLTAMHNEPRQCKTQAQVGDAIDRVFDKVLGPTFEDLQLLEVDDFI